MTISNPPPLKIPPDLEKNPLWRGFFRSLTRALYQLWFNSGGHLGGILQPTQGGTGVDNGTNTITLGGNIVTSGSFTLSGSFPATFTFTGSTSVIFPTSGTLATLAGTETLTNKTIDTANNNITVVSGDMSDFQEAVADRVDSLLIEAGNIKLTYNDPGDTLEIKNEYAVETINDTHSPYSATVDKDKLILADTTSGTIIINLPTAATWKHKLTIKNIGTGSNNVTINANGSEEIDTGLAGGGASITLVSPGTITLASDLSNLFII